MDSAHSKALSLYLTGTGNLTHTQSSILILDSYSKKVDSIHPYF